MSFWEGEESMKGFYQAGKEVFHGTKRLEKRMSIKNLNCVFESTK